MSYVYWGPLHYAAESGADEIVKLLIAMHVNPNVLTTSNTTPRYWASINRHRNIEKFLVAHGALDIDQEYEMICKKLDAQTIPIPPRKGKK